MINKHQEIISEIEKYYSSEIDSKEKVIFFFNRIRIFIESQRKKSEYKLLNFFGNWISHNEIQKVPTKIIDSLKKESVDTSLSSFFIIRGELCKLAQDNDFMNRELLNNQTKWNIFTKNLLSVISEIPLRNNEIEFEFEKQTAKDNSYFSSTCRFKIYERKLIKKASISFNYFRPIDNSSNNEDWLTEEGKCK